MKKYELTDEIKVIETNQGEIILHRIRAFVDIPEIRKQLPVGIDGFGGWIEKEENLSQEGIAWVDKRSIVYGNARVYGDAFVAYGSIVCDNAQVYDNAWVGVDTKIHGNAKIYGHAMVGTGANIYDETEIFDYASVSGVEISGKIRIQGGAQLGGSFKICGVTNEATKHAVIDSITFSEEHAADKNSELLKHECNGKSLSKISFF